MHLYSVDARAFHAQLLRWPCVCGHRRRTRPTKFKPSGQSFALHARRGDKLVRPGLAISLFRHGRVAASVGASR